MGDSLSRTSQPEQPNLRVAIGTHVHIELVDDQGQVEGMEFDITPDRAANYGGGLLGEGTPLAKAILGQAAGAEIPYRVEELRSVRILAVTPSDPSAAQVSEAQRKEAMAKVVRETERTNAINFASSFSGKWGDYDPGGVEQWDKDQKED